MEEYEEVITLEEKLRIVSGFLLDSPPGEIKDVLNDIRALVGEDESIEESLVDTLRKYNTEQLITAQLPDQSTLAIVCEASSLGDDRYIDPSTKKTFTFDHIHQTVSEVQDVTADNDDDDDENEEEKPENDTEAESYRQAIHKTITDYTADHYPQKATAVFSNNNTITIIIVGNKYSPSNCWNGRWRSIWTWNRDTNSLKGKLTINVHYYEDGNVQLSSSKSIEESVASTSPPETAAEQISKLIAHAEDEYQRGLNTGYAQLSNNTFKSLRRTLPITRSKLNWDKIANYKIGTELTKK